MTALYNEYLTGDDRELAIIFAESDAQVAKLNILYESVNAKLEADFLAAEAKVLTENGTYDDLTMLYTEAEGEANTNKRNILQRLIDWIVSTFRRIANFITGKVDTQLETVPDGTEIQVPAETKEGVNIITKAWDFIKKPFDVIKNGSDGGYNAKDVAASWATITAEAVAIGLTAAAGGTAASAKIKADKAKKNGETTHESKETVISWENNMKNIQSIVAKAGNGLKTVLGIGKVANNITKAKGEPTETPANGSESQATSEKTLGDKLLDLGTTVLNAILDIGGWIGKVLSWIVNALKNVTTKKNTETPTETPAKGKSEGETSTETPVEVELDDKELVWIKKYLKATNRENELDKFIADAIQMKKKKTLEGFHAWLSGTKCMRKKNGVPMKFESTSIEDADLDLFLESELVEEEYNELVEAFAEL